MDEIRSDVDREAGTLTFTTELDAGPDRVWQVWVDPRQLERWWGPPTWPATFDEHDPVAGGRSEYRMTGPDGDESRGWWTTIAADAPTRYEFEDGFARDDGTHDDSMPTTHTVVTLDEVEGGTRMTSVTVVSGSVEQFDQLLEMGMLEGMTLAMGQIDGILAGS